MLLLCCQSLHACSVVHDTTHITCMYCSMKTVSEEAIGSWLASESVQAYVHGIHEGKVRRFGLAFVEYSKVLELYLKYV